MLKGEDVLRILFYQDKKQMPILPTLQKALGDAAAFLHAERLAPDTLVLTPGLVSGSAMLNAVCPPSGYAARAADGAGRLHPDARPRPSGGGERCACGCRA